MYIMGSKLINAYVLSKTSSFRNPKLYESLEAAGLNVIWVPAPTPQQAENYISGITIPRAVMSPVEVACALGHRLMYEKAIFNQDSTALFLEDDAKLSVDFGSIILDLEKLLVNNAVRRLEIILLGSCGGFARKKSILDLKTHKILWAIGSSIMGSHAYVASLEGIRDLYLHSYAVPRLADSFHRSKATKLYIVYPHVAYQIFDTTEIIVRHDRERDGSLKMSRKYISSAILDLKDRAIFKHFGGRFINLDENQKILSRLFIALEGCRFDM